MTDEEARQLAEYGQTEMLRILGINKNSYQSVQGTSVADWSSRWTADLGSLGGYYDTGKANSLYSSLGNTTSATYMNQLGALAQESNRLYTLVSNPNQVVDKLRSEAEKTGGVLQLGVGMGFRNEGSGGYAYDLMGNRFNDITMSPIFKSLYDSIDSFSREQDNLVNQLNAQQSREQSYVSQINSLTQSATLAKTTAEQAAAQQALQQQYQQQQSELNAQAEAAQRELAEKQAQQTKMFNETSQATAISNAASAQLQQAKTTAAQAEGQSGSVRGGEAISSTNAASKSKTRQTTRTERWQSTRSPAAGGGGISV